jgi:hypothetical protein
MCSALCKKQFTYSQTLQEQITPSLPFITGKVISRRRSSCPSRPNEFVERAFLFAPDVVSCLCHLVKVVRVSMPHLYEYLIGTHIPCNIIQKKNILPLFLHVVTIHNLLLLIRGCTFYEHSVLPVSVIVYNF